MCGEQVAFAKTLNVWEEESGEPLGGTGSEPDTVSQLLAE